MCGVASACVPLSFSADSRPLTPLTAGGGGGEHALLTITVGSEIRLTITSILRFSGVFLRESFTFLSIWSVLPFSPFKRHSCALPSAARLLCRRPQVVHHGSADVMVRLWGCPRPRPRPPRARRARRSARGVACGLRQRGAHRQDVPQQTAFRNSTLLTHMHKGAQRCMFVREFGFWTS